MKVQAILTVTASIGWIVFGAILLGRGVNPNNSQDPAFPSFARRALIATPLLLLMMATYCVFVLKFGVLPARLGDYLLLRDPGAVAGQMRAGLAVSYAVYLLALTAPDFLRPDRGKVDRLWKDFKPPGPVDATVEWKRRCDKFRSRNRSWLIAVFAWLATAGALTTYAYLGVVTEEAYAYLGLLVLIGLAVFGIASLTLPMLLVCPNCGCRPRGRRIKLHRWLDEIETCELCHAKLNHSF